MSIDNKYRYTQKYFVPNVVTKGKYPFLPEILGITGKKGSGKNTVADIINKYTAVKSENEDFSYDNSFKMCSFAEPLKRMVSAMIGIPYEDFEELKDTHIVKFPSADYEGDYGNLCNMTIRDILQRVGTDLFREHYSKQFFINMFIKKYNQMGAFDRVMITDVRFGNECKYILSKRYGFVVRVERDILGSIDSHESENGNFHVPYVIKNNGTLDDLEEEVVKMLERFKIDWEL